ncbi:MAG: amino acid permease [Leptospiraceae bacterium]|nr:amino acid permease [Leptospiraceae bacterium]MDW7976383.1 amino acid permease [Leptospiraceae bacterium]
MSPVQVKEQPRIKEKEKLKRQIGLWTAMFVVMASMIGSGIFGNTGIIQSAVQNSYMVLFLWFIGGIIALAGALSYAELSTLMPHAGGEYVYLKNIFGLLPSFLTGWVSFIVAFSAPAAASGLLASEYLHKALIVFDPHHEITHFFDKEEGRKIFASSLIVLFTLIHIIEVKKGGYIQNFLTILKVSLIILFLFLGFSVIFQNSNYQIQQNLKNDPVAWNGIGLGLLFVMFAYSGWNGATYLAEEIQNPEKNLPRALIGGTVIVMILYLLLNLLYYWSTPATEFEGKEAIAAITAKNLFGNHVTIFFNIGFFVILLSTISATIMVGPRVYYAMARDNLFFRAAAHLHPKFHTPIISFLIQGILAIIYIWSGTYEQIQTYMGFALSVFPLLSVIGLMYLKKKNRNLKGPYQTPLYPLFPLIFIIFSIITMVVSFIGRPFECSVAILAILMGIPFYLVWTKYVLKNKET